MEDVKIKILALAEQKKFNKLPALCLKIPFKLDVLPVYP